MQGKSPATISLIAILSFSICALVAIPILGQESGFSSSSLMPGSSAAAPRALLAAERLGQNNRLYRGDGTLRPQSSSPVFFNVPAFPQTGLFSSSIVVGDFNNDGNKDFAIANQCQNSNCVNGGVTIYLGNGNGSFQTGATYSSGGYEAYSIAAADLNRDGNTDLVVVNGCQSSTECGNGIVGVLLGNGDGTFQTAQTYSSGGVVATAVAVGGLNTGKKLDLVVANQCQDSSCTNGSVSVLLGNGDGTFGSAQSYPSGGVEPIAVGIGDFTGNHINDLVVVNECQTSSNCTGSVGVLLGNGNGTFKNVQTFSSGAFTAYSVAVGDLNGDGKLDLAVANQCQTASHCSNGVVGVLLGNGDGTFQTARTFASSGAKSSFVALADLNGDNHPDLVVVDQCQSINGCFYGSLSVLFGKGDGTFKHAQGFVTEGVQAYAAALADFNKDGKLDAVVANQCQTSSNCAGVVTELLGAAGGSFQVPPAYSGGGYNTDAAATGDLNLDGNVDIVAGNLCTTSSCDSNENGEVSVLLGNGNGTFKTGQTYSSGGFGATAVAIGTLTPGGNPDVVIANQCAAGGCSTGASVAVLLGNGNGTLKSAQTYATGGFNASSVAIADVNGDGNPDLIVANQCQTSDCSTGGNVSVLLGNGNGTFQSAQTYSAVGFNTASVVVADFNGDGFPDIALANECQDSTCQNGLISVLLNNGNGTFKSAQTYNSLGAEADSITTADFNGDGIPDLAVANLCEAPANCSEGYATVLTGKGDGTFRGGRHYATGAQDAYSVVANDFNGDGAADLVVANGNGTTLLLGNGDATFQNATPYFPGGVFVQQADFNNDGKPDLVVANGLSTTVTVLLNVVSGYRHSTSTTLTSSPNPSSAYQSVLFTATITSQYKGSPSGTVTFMDGSTVLGKGSVSNGQATLNYPFPSPGMQRITADYSGDSVFLPSSSTVLKQQVTKAQTTTTLASNPNPSQQGQQVTFTATVAGAYGGTPTGTIQFKMHGNVLATVHLSNGSAIYRTSSLPKGKDKIFAWYSGDDSFKPSNGNVLQMVE